GDDRRDAEVALARGRRPHAHRVVGEADVQRVGIGRRVHRDRLDPELVECADDAHRDLAAIRDQHARKHFYNPTGRPFSGSRSNRSCPYSTGSALPTWILRTTASISAFTSFISFIASRMQRVWPAATPSPSSPNQ